MKHFARVVQDAKTDREMVVPDEKDGHRHEHACSLYMIMLRGPTSWLAGNTLERADVKNVAILGYN